MVRVERANVVLHVKDEEVQHYLSLGYNVTDEMGHIIQESIPNDLGVLRKFYKEGKEKIKVLEARIAELEAQITSSPAAEAEPVVESTTPRTRKKRGE